MYRYGQLCADMDGERNCTGMGIQVPMTFMAEFSVCLRAEFPGKDC